MSDLKSQLIKLGSTNPELRPHLREVLDTLSLSKVSNLKGYSQSGGSPKTPEDRRIADTIKKALERAGIWRGNRWEYFLNYQDGFDPTTTIGYSTYDMGDYFAISFETFGPNAGDVVVNHGGEYEYFPNLNAAQRWLQQNFG